MSSSFDSDPESVPPTLPSLDNNEREPVPYPEGWTAAVPATGPVTEAARAPAIAATTMAEKLARMTPADRAELESIIDAFAPAVEEPPQLPGNFFTRSDEYEAKVDPRTAADLGPPPVEPRHYPSSESLKAMKGVLRSIRTMSPERLIDVMDHLVDVLGALHLQQDGDLSFIEMAEVVHTSLGMLVEHGKK